MTDQMQKFGHRESPYSRPNQKWRCGRGEGCKSGPDPAGRCPLADNPCKPVRSVKAQKRQYFFLMLGIAFFSIVIFFTGKTTLDHLSPGPLSVNHAQVTTCKDCHSAVAESVFDWIHKAVHLNSNNDDEKCLNCHKLGENAFSPHSASSSVLTASASAATAKSSAGWDVELAGYLRDQRIDGAENVSCALCHREHQGRFASIDEFDSQQCHVCHTVKFANLETQHPPYTEYPYKRPTRIKFDHVSHLKKHFVDEDHVDHAPDGCKQCHDPDQSGEWMLANSFESSCANCHLGEILGDARANAKGVAVLSIPEIDIQSLEEAGLYIGQWPEWADGELTPIMQLLLPSKLQPAAADFSRPMALVDLSNAAPDELRAAAEVAWAIKELLYDIQMGGTALMNRRIAEALDENLDQSTLNLLVASLPKDTLVNNQKEWFPMLMEEVGQFRSGAINLTGMAGGGDNASDSDDNTANAIDADPASDIPVERDDSIVPGDEISLDDLSDDELLSSELIELDDVDLLAEDDDAISFDQDLLTIEPGDLLLDDDEADEGNEEQTAAAALRQSMQAVYDNEEWARSGGWYRDGSTIFYRPIGHADPFLKTWIDVSAVNAGPIGQVIFASFNDDEAVGKCVKCHSVEVVSGKGQMNAEMKGPAGAPLGHRINWHGFTPENVGIEFNRFSHTSHFGLMNDEGCSSCHKLNTEAPEGTDESALSFAFIEKETCTQCHQQGRAPDTCLTCHNYHVEPDARSIELIADYLRDNTDPE